MPLKNNLQSVAKQAQLRHVLLDIDFRNKPKVIDLQQEYGALARLLFIDMLSAMSGSTNGGIKKTTIIHLGVPLEIFIEKIEAIINYLLQNQMIFQKNDFYFNSRVLKDQISLGAKRANTSERVKKFRDRKRVTDTFQDGYKTVSSDPVSVSDTVLDINYKIVIPNPYDTPEIREAVSKWQAKLRLNGRQYDQMQFDSHLMSMGAEGYVNAVKYSCGLSKTKNLYSMPEKELIPAIKKTNHERNKENFLKDIGEI